MRVLGHWNGSVVLTYAGVAAAILGMALTNPASGFVCLVVAGVADLFDGVVARRFDRTAEQQAFGVQLDSLADMVGFVALPIVLALRTTGDAWWQPLVLIGYAVAAIARLAYFNVITEAPADYHGLPVTYAALALPLVYLLGRAVPSVYPPVLWTALAVLASAYVVDVRIAKPRGLAYGFFAALAVVTVVLLLWTA